MLTVFYPTDRIPKLKVRSYYVQDLCNAKLALKYRKNFIEVCSETPFTKKLYHTETSCNQCFEINGLVSI